MSVTVIPDAAASIYITADTGRVLTVTSDADRALTVTANTGNSLIVAVGPSESGGSSSGYIRGSMIGVVANSLDISDSVYTVGLSDVWNYRRLTNSSGCLLILPSGVSWPDDSTCYFRRETNAGLISFSSSSGNIVPNDNAVADVGGGGVFAVKKLGSTNSWDFI